MKKDPVVIYWMVRYNVGTLLQVTVLLQKLDVNEKLDIIGNEYGILLEENLKEKVNIMSN